ncbi:GNAT family N-acetyltransferase [Erwinia typographi]|nr:GNAT family N-acetyltransferase [Erwinia typographi]
MIDFKAMTADQFSAFVQYLIPDYAEEISSSYRLPPDEALAQAQREIEASFPAGEKTAGQVLLSIFHCDSEQQHHAGYLWYRPDSLSKSAFIYDFTIFPQYQGKGLGSESMKALEKILREQGVTQIKLRVAAGNDRAKHVYESNGYRVNGFNMNKLL